MSGGYQRSTARTRASQAVRSANTGPAITSRTLWPVSTSQSGTDSSPVGSTPSRPAANPATVATSTLCPGEGSQVTGNLTGYPR